MADSLNLKSKYDSICHYTSSAAFHGILSGQEIWLSNVGTMNDIDEVVRGSEIILELVRDPGFAHLSSARPIRDALLRCLEETLGQLRSDTYVFCFSGHSLAEDVDGRLPMWRAYGKDGNGVCVVMDRDLLLRGEVVSFPVSWGAMLYESPQLFKKRVASFFVTLDALVEKEGAFLAMFPTEALARFIAAELAILALSHKNTAFEEEREFRYMHVPALTPLNDPALSYDAIVRDNRLRPVLKLPIRQYDVGQTIGGTFGAVVKEVIVGPSNDGPMQERAIRIALAKRGFSNVIVRSSRLPYRSVR
jgi:hypothetical protein